MRRLPTIAIAAAALACSVHAREGFRFAVISDPQVRDEDHYSTDICRKALKDLSQFDDRPLFVIATGDMVDGRSGHSMDCPASTYRPQYALLDKLIAAHLAPSIKLYPVVGNHDYHRSGDGSLSGPELYAKFWFERIPQGVSPANSPYYSFDHGNVHFVVICTGLLGVRKAPDYRDLVFGDQYEWLSRDLARAAKRENIRHILVFGHHNFHPVKSKGKSGWKGLAAVRERIWQGLFVKHRVEAYFHGHWHFYDRGVPQGGIPYVCLGGLDGQERPAYPQLKVNHYALVDVKGEQVKVSVYLLGRQLYDQFTLHDLAAGRTPPPQVTVEERYRQLKAPRR